MLLMFSGPASGVASVRSDDLAGVQRTQAQRRERNAGQFVKRASFARSVKEQGPAIPGRGNGPLSNPCRLAGLTQLFDIAMKAKP